MKRIVPYFLTCLLLAAAVSCGDADTANPTDTTSADPQNTAQTETSEPSLLDGLGERDLGGYVYTVFDCNDLYMLQVNIPGDEMTGEIVNDALLTRDLTIKERYNCDIRYFQYTEGDGMKKLSSTVLAGDDEWQIIYAAMSMLNGQASSGVLADLCEVPYIEPDKTWWNPLLYENLRLNDAMYFTSSDIAPGIYQMPTCMFLNLQLYTDYDYDADIFNMVIDGKWTLEALQSMIKGMDTDLNQDNKWTLDDFYGLAMQNSAEAALTMLLGTGVRMSDITSDGTSITADIIDNDRLLHAAEVIAEMCPSISYGSDVNELSTVLFNGNRALFLVHKLETAAVHLRQMESDYLILPTPKYDESQESYISFLSPHGRCFIAVPQTSQLNEEAGFLTEAMARYSNQYVRPIAYELVYKDKDSRDPRTAEVLDILLDNLYIDFQSLYNFGNVNETLANVIFKDVPLVSNLTKRAKSLEKDIAALVEYWGNLD